MKRLKIALIICLSLIIISSVLFSIYVAYCFIYATLNTAIHSVNEWQEGARECEPAVKYGEFPYKLVYEINGKTVVVEDTYVCEFDRVRFGFDTPYIRVWKTYHKNTGKKYIFVTNVKYGEEIGEVIITIGSYQYYMDDMWPINDTADFEPRAKIHILYSSGVWESVHSGEKPEGYEDFPEIKIISFEYTPAIENSFVKDTYSEEQ